VSCLYISDYGPADPGFDPLVDGSRLLQGFEAHATELARAQNLGQLQAMERQLQRGERIVWCDQGYGWAEGPAVQVLLAAFMALVVLPHAIKRLTPRTWGRLVDLAHGASRTAGERSRNESIHPGRP
jgi:hypothetical protein